MHQDDVANKHEIHKVVQELIDLIKAQGWEEKFEEAIKNAHKQRVTQIKPIHNLNDYLAFINNLLYWSHLRCSKKMASQITVIPSYLLAY